MRGIYGLGGLSAPTGCGVSSVRAMVDYDTLTPSHHQTPDRAHLHAPDQETARVGAVATFDECAALVSRLQTQIRRVFIGQDEVVKQVLVACLAGGHVLLRGVPGLAKTLLIKTLAQAVALKFSRIQFTPDLMPSDIIGTEVIEEDRGTGKRSHPFHPGPDLREHPSRRRDQPHAAEDPGGAAGGDAGTPGDGQRRPLRADAAVLRAGDAESHRAGGHLSPARSPARSVSCSTW